MQQRGYEKYKIIDSTYRRWEDTIAINLPLKLPSSSGGHSGWIGDLLILHTKWINRGLHSFDTKWKVARLNSVTFYMKGSVKILGSESVPCNYARVNSSEGLFSQSLRCARHGRMKNHHKKCRVALCLKNKCGWVVSVTWRLPLSRSVEDLLFCPAIKGRAVSKVALLLRHQFSG